MPKVIGFDPKIPKNCTCKNCSAVIEYLPKERKSQSYTDYGGFTDTYHYIDCPNCGEKVEV